MCSFIDSSYTPPALHIQADPRIHAHAQIALINIWRIIIAIIHASAMGLYSRAQPVALACSAFTYMSYKAPMHNAQKEQPTHARQKTSSQEVEDLPPKIKYLYSHIYLYIIHMYRLFLLAGIHLQLF